MSSNLILAVISAISIIAGIIFAWNGKGPWGWLLFVGVLLASGAVGS